MPLMRFSICGVEVGVMVGGVVAVAVGLAVLVGMAVAVGVGVLSGLKIFPQLLRNMIVMIQEIDSAFFNAVPPFR
jgi:hypothetical protein